MNLYYRTIGSGPPLIILHGIFGSSDNWGTLGRQFGEFRQVYLVDQRNHGRSPHDPQFNYQVMVEDLREFIVQHDLLKPDIMGHSMGGKTSMFFATKYPDMINKLVVVDIAPRAYPVHHDFILRGLAALPLDKLQSRQQADAELARYIDNPAIRQFLLKNLQRTDQGFRWKINLPVIQENIAHVGQGLDREDVFTHPTLFIRGGLSPYIQEEDYADIAAHFPNSKVVTIAGATHWVHADKPAELYKAVKDFLLEA